MSVTSSFWVATAACVLVAAGVTAQVPPLGGSAKFEVASIKPNTIGGTASGANFREGGRFVARNATLQLLLLVAYGDPRPLAPAQLAGGPSWLASARFDIEAKAGAAFPASQGGTGAPEAGVAMLRALLADRFGLVAHMEKREIPVYALVRRNDARLGPRLRVSTGADCVSGAPAPPSGNTPSGSPPRCGSYILSNTGGMQFAITARGLTLAALAKNLQNVAGRVVLDRTALPGTFSFDLNFELRPPTADPGPDAGMGAAIFTAMQEQLGLRLDATRAPVDVVVVDRAEQPSPD